MSSEFSYNQLYLQKNVKNKMHKWKHQDNSTIYANDQGEKKWITRIKYNAFMVKENIFVLMKIKKKTTTKALMLKPCSHNVFDSLSHTLQTLQISLTKPHSSLEEISTQNQPFNHNSNSMSSCVSQWNWFIF